MSKDSSLAATVTEQEGRVKVSGHVLFDTVPSLRSAGERLILAGLMQVDLSEVQDADSSALALLLEWERVAARAGKSLSFTSVPAQIREIAALSELDQVLDLQA